MRNTIYQTQAFAKELGRELKRDAKFRNSVLIIAAVVLLVVVLIISSVRENKRQKELIASGLCEAITEALYQPPPTYTCVSRNKDGICLVQTPIYHSPYMRTLWRCEGERDFWRRSGS